MTLTRVGDTNKLAFEPLLFGIAPEGNNRITLGMVEKKKPVGVGVFDVDGTVVTITHIYVVEMYRRKGIATKIVNEFLDDAAAFSYFAANADYISNEELNAFFAKQEFSVIEEDPIYALPLRKLVTGPVMEFLEESQGKNQVKTVAQMSEAERNNLTHVLLAHGLDAEVLQMGLCEELSIVVMDELGDPLTVVFTDDVSKDICIRYMANFTNEPSNLRKALYLLGTLVRKDKELAAGNLLFVIVDAAMEKLVRYILQEIELVPNSHMANAYKLLTNEEGDF
ncbi:MAG: N-acetyltransferase [Lachnospiraceae bacterium]|nr:N-acetyltransferase [Lachnospiraceae bacterium]